MYKGHKKWGKEQGSNMGEWGDRVRVFNRNKLFGVCVNLIRISTIDRED